MLAEKNIVVGVTGGIAAYKAVDVVSRLKKRGAAVHVIMTQAATQFVTPLTFREISGQPVVTDMWSEPKRWKVEHIALASIADLFLIVPATANIIGKIAGGIADDMLSTTVMATTAQVMLAPAMNTNMYLNFFVQQNLAKLAAAGHILLEPECGKLACGTEGQGRLPEPETIVRHVLDFFSKKKTLDGKKVLVTAGGTREPIDPVRYIGNRSSGKMGYSLAAAAAGCGAQVVLISGPVNLKPPPGVTVKYVETTAQMLEAVLAEYGDSDIVIKAAAVADYRPENVAEHKIKKSEAKLEVALVKNPDILMELGRRKQRQILVGFAAETKDLLVHAQDKLYRKNLDLIVANDVSLPDAGFNVDTNIAKLIYRDGRIEDLPKMSKDSLAELIIEKISEIR
jgi:phosphopantothenoylcysteine decarboxylase/phosphopantothenate--cysteine ligase